MKIKLDFWVNGKASLETEAESLKVVVEECVRAGVSLRYVNLERADLNGVDLERADLRGANLNYADLRGANLNGADLERAHLRGADLERADLDGANLNYANLDGAYLNGAYLKGADLRGANLNYADLRGANLNGAKNLRMPTGETWEEYLTQTLPALLTAGGHALDDVANEEHWVCHDWTNCPIKAAFDVDSTDKVHPLYRQHAKQFLSLFDANQISLEIVNPKMAKKDA